MDSVRPEVLAYLALVALLALGWLVYLWRRRRRHRVLQRARRQAGGAGAGAYAQRHEPGAGLAHALNASHATNSTTAAPLAQQNLENNFPPASPPRGGVHAVANLTAPPALNATVNNPAANPGKDLAMQAASWRGRIFGVRANENPVPSQPPNPVAQAQPAAGLNVVPANAAPVNAEPADFANYLQRASAERTLEVEVLKLRQEVAQLRAELAHVASALQQLKTVRPVAPAYTEAVALARQGLSISDIAAQCGISLGEAELVFSLAQSEGQHRGA